LTLPSCSERREYEVGELICGDLGPQFEVKQTKGYLYPFIFMDYASKFIFVYFCKSKSDIGRVLNLLKTDIESNGYHWRKFQCDAENIFTMGDARQFFDSNGIQLHISAPYKHGQNGDIERTIGMLYDLTRYHMLSSEAPPSLTMEAMKYAAYILNDCRVPSSLSITPSEKFTGIRPSMKTKFKFFQTAAAYISRPERHGKMSPKAEIVKLLGYAEEFKDSYVIYNPNNRTVKIRHDIKLLETNDMAHQTLDQTLISEQSQRPIKPNSLDEALAGQDRDKWIEAIHKELQECFSRGTFRKTSMKFKSDIKPIRSRMLLDIKADGTFKARWVACGYSQVPGRDYDETFAPTAQFKSVLTLLHIAAVYDEEIFAIDIGNAFLESTLDKPILMEIPRDLRKLMEWDDEPVEIVNGLYGLKQAGRLWYELIKKILIEYGMKQSIYDSCVFSKMEDDVILRISLHVDDILLTSKSIDKMNNLITYLESKLKKVKVNRNTTDFTYLRVNILRDRAKHIIAVSQREYVEKILSEYSIGSEISSFPIEVNNIDLSNGEKTENPPIHEIIGKLRFLVDRTRPDLLYPVHVLSRVMHNPTNEIMSEVYRLLKYVNFTKTFNLLIGGEELNLMAMSDASFIHEHGSRSQLAYVVLLGTLAGSVSTFSKRAENVALSSTQSECDALVETLKEIIWFQGFLESIHINVEKPTIILVDNKPVVILAGEGNHQKKSKHFIVKTNFIKQEQSSGNVFIQHVAGIDNRSDLCTKALKGHSLKYHTSALLGHFLLKAASEEKTVEKQLKIM
jgi:hypothetical protein